MTEPAPRVAPDAGRAGARAPRRALARGVAVLGALGAGWFLFGEGPREVVLVYDVSAVPQAADLEVEVRREGEVLRRARFHLAASGQVRHALQLPDGDYALAWRLGSPSGVRQGERRLEIREAGTVVLPLAP